MESSSAELCAFKVLLAESEDRNAPSSLTNAACPVGLHEKATETFGKTVAWVSREPKPLLFCDSIRDHKLASLSFPPQTTLK